HCRPPQAAGSAPPPSASITSCGHPPTPTGIKDWASPSMRKVEGDAGHNGVGFEEECPLDEKRVLIMEEVLPPVLWHELGQHYRDVVLRVVLLDPLDIFEQRFHQRSIGRIEDDKADSLAPLVPLAPQILRRHGVDVDVDRPHVV